MNGWVQNSVEYNMVECCLQGEKNKVNEMIEFIRASPGRPEVMELKITDQPNTPAYKEFSIRY